MTDYLAVANVVIADVAISDFVSPKNNFVFGDN